MMFTVDILYDLQINVERHFTNFFYQRCLAISSLKLCFNCNIFLLTILLLKPAKHIVTVLKKYLTNFYVLPLQNNTNFYLHNSIYQTFYSVCIEKRQQPPKSNKKYDNKLVADENLLNSTTAGILI